MLHILMIIAAVLLGPNMHEDNYHYEVDSQLSHYRMCMDLEADADRAECLDDARANAYGL